MIRDEPPNPSQGHGVYYIELFQGGEQAGERHHGGLRCEGLALNSSGGRLIPRPQAPPSQTAYLQNRTALGKSRAVCALVGGLVAAELEPAASVLGGDGGEGGAERIVERLV